MGYVTQEELATRFGADELIAIADRDRDGTADPAVIEQAITDASAEIDSYLGTRYSVPLDEAPAAVKSACADIARYRLMDERPLDEVTKRYDSAIRFLRDVATGRASLGITQTKGVEAAPFVYAATPTERTFNRDTLADY